MIAVTLGMQIYLLVPRRFPHYVLVSKRGVTTAVCKMASLWTYTTSTGEDRNLVTLLECGELYEYTVDATYDLSASFRN